MEHRKKWKSRILSLTLSAAMLINGMTVLPAYAIDAAVDAVSSLMQTENTAAHTEAFEYALFTGNADTTLEMNAQKVDITGDVHSNSNFIYRGSEIVLNGSCEAVNDITISVSDANYLDKVVAVKNETESVILNDYSEEIYAHLIEQGVPEYPDWMSFSDAYVDISNGIMVNGTLGVYSSQFTGSGIIYAQNSINYSVGEISNSDGGFVVFCAANGDININASNTTINGIIYAPNGTVTITGSNVTINGRIIADKFNFWGSNLTINSGDSDLDILDFLFLPSPEIIADGEFKENRKVSLDISQTEKIEKVTKEETTWAFYKVSGDERVLAVEGEDYAIDADTSDEFLKNMIFKKFGTYEVEVTVRSGNSEKTSVKTLEITEDLCPIVDFTIDSDYYYRNPENESKASIVLKDFSYSIDNDEIAQRIWTVYHDVNNDGIFDDVEAEVISDANETELTYEVNKVGNFKVELTSVETFSNTIPSLITDEDFQRANTDGKVLESKTFTIGNVSPESNVDIGIAKDVDLVFTVGSSDTETVNLYADKIEEIKSELEAQGYTVHLSTVETSSLSAKDSFAWTEYDHYNYRDSYLPTLEKHIIYDGSNIQMLGYGRAALKDFLLVNDENESQKIFTFDIKRDSTDWHSMEGGGFLFNTSVKDDTIQGFYILITQSGLKLCQIQGLSVASFQGGSRSSIVQLRTFPFSDPYAEHNLKIVVDKNSISLWDGETQVIDNYLLPENDYGYGYGPITSHASHSCGQQSYFTFNNIKMETITGENLSDVLANYDWSSQTGRYVINLSDSQLQEFETDEELALVAEQILENELTFIGIGNDSNSQQYADIINYAAGNGVYLNSADTENSLNHLSNYIVSTENEKDYSVDYYVAKDQPIRYINAYSDTEQDPMYEECWEYEYDPSVFYNESGQTEIQKFTSNEPVTVFEEAGAYTMRLKVRDNPVGDNDALDEYRLWSGENSYEKVLMVHNRPIAELTVEVSENPNNNSTVIINTKDNCYDYDHLNESNKGIVSKEYKWKKLTDTTWTDGPIPNKVEIGGIYLICLTVTDEEGQVSYPNVQVINTNDYFVPEQVDDTERPVIYLELEQSKANAGESVKITGYATDNMGVDTFEIYVNGERVLDHAGRVFYTGDCNETVEIKAVAIDINGNRAEEVQQLVIEDKRDKTAPVVEIESPDNQSIMDFSVQFVGSAYDETLLTNYRLEYRRQGTDNYTVISEADSEVRSGILGEWDVYGLESGVYEVKLSATDGAGNTAYVVYQYELKPNSENGIIDSDEVDHAAPIIILDVSSDTVSVGEEVAFSVDVDDESQISAVQVYIDDELAMEGTGEITLSKGEAGVTKIKVYASDEFGNTSVKEASIIFIDDSDKEVPIALITTPEHAATISGSVDIVGSAYDETEMLRYRLQYKEQDAEEFTTFAEMYNQVEDGILGTLNASVLEDGVYDVRLTVEDKSGNYSYVEYAYIVDNSQSDTTGEDIVKPAIDIVVSKTEAEIGEEVSCIVSVTDNQKLEAVKVYLDDELILSGNGSFTFTRGSASVAKIKVYAVDAAGNMNSLTEECIFVDYSDKNAPCAEITSPVHASEIYGSVNISGTAMDEEEILRYILQYRLQGTDDFITFAEETQAVENGVLGTLDTSSLLNGVYEVRLTVEDEGGNASYVQYSYVVNNENEGSGMIPSDDEKDIIDPVIKLVLSKSTTSINEMVKAYVTVSDNQEIDAVHVFVDDEEVVLDGHYIEFTSAEVGKVTIKVTATDSSGNTAVKTAVCNFFNLSDKIAPELDITAPEYDATLSAPTEIVGSVFDETALAYYTVEYRMKGEEAYTLLLESSEEKHDEVLAVFDTTILANGIYEIKVSAVDYGGNMTYITGQYVVEGNLKIGNLNLGFEDVSTEISGIQVSAARYYNSTNKQVGDFGVGWTLGLGSVQVHEMNSMSDYWNMSMSGEQLGTYYSVQETASHDVVITYGDGTSERFTAKLKPSTQRYAPLMVTSIVFESSENSKNTLEVYGDNRVQTFGYTGDINLFDDDGDLFEVKKYKLTMEDGTVLILNKNSGVESITDKYGNVITVSANGWCDANGNGLVFTRDAENRITEISSSDGKNMRYSYDDDNNLIKVTDALNNTVSFVYDDDHNIVSIIDSRGYEAARNEYDEDGRLIATIDAYGNRTEFEHDVEGRTEVVTDKLGYKTIYTYDDRGNVLSVTDANNNTVYSSYDEYGQLTQQIDALGNVTNYQISATGDILSVTNALGQTVENSYNSENQLVSVTAMGVTQMIINYDEDGLLTSTEDALGNGTYYTYDSSYRVTGISDEIGSTISFVYDADGNVISSTNGEGETASYTYDANGNCISKTITKVTENETENLVENYEYDALGRVIRIIYADNSSTSVEYDGNGNMTAAVDEKGRRTQYDYDGNNNLIKITYCDNTTETFEYDAEGRNTKATDRMGRSVTMTYDKVGNLLSKTYANGAVESYMYDDKYRPVSITGVNGGVTTYEYDAIDRNTAIIDDLGNKTTFEYDEQSRLCSMTDPNGNVYRYEYDANGNRTKIVMPDGTAISTAYDARGRITSQTDQNGYVTTYAYDGADRLISVTDALGSKWEYTYNNVGELVEVKDANGNSTKYEYDALGRVIKTTNAAGKTAECTYDESGNILTSTDYAGVKTTYTYDELDRLVKQDVDGEVTEYAYTTNGYLSSVTDASGTIRYNYDKMDGLASVTLADGTEIHYSYDTACRLTEVSTPYGDTSYAYDTLDRLVRVVDRNGVATLYEYDANGNRTAVKYTNGIIVTYEYNEVNQLIREEIVDKDSNVVVEYIYTLGKAGERLAVTEPDSVTEYTYDALYRLTGEKVTKDGSTTETSYTYDPVGNRLTKTENGEVTKYSYNSLNQLVSETGITYAYDDNGNLISKTEANQTTTYTFNKQNRLIRATISSGQDVAVEEYEYDYAGNRTAKITEGETIRYIVDTNGVLSQVLYELDGNGSLKTYYTRGTELISLERTGELRYYLFDGHGNVRVLTDENGSVTDTYDYDAFGNLTERTGETENSYLYCGEQYDANTGFYYLRARYMNPTTGTFISMDSYQGSLFDPVSLHKYLYANANPVMFTDPTGYFSLGELNITQAMQSILNKISTPKFINILNKINDFATIYDTGVQIFRTLTDPNMSADQMLQAITSGIITSLFINKMCSIKAIGPLISKIFVGLGLVSQFDSIMEAAEDGDWDLVAARTAQLAIQLITMHQTCFTGETLVAAENGQKRIDKIEVGDKVWAYNVETGETELKEVLTVYVHDQTEILHLHTTAGDIDTTTNHPFYVLGRGWVAAGDLAEGDEVYLIDGSTAFITGAELEKLAEPIKVYNLEVADFNTYFVGDEAVLVHNYPSSDGTPSKTPTNKHNEPYPSVPDPRTGENIPFPSGDISKVPKDQRVDWDGMTRHDFIKEWYDRGYGDLPEDWSKYDIHHILPREYGGTNDFDNLVPLLRETTHKLFTAWWAGY